MGLGDRKPWRGENSLCREFKPGNPAHSVITMLTELYRHTKLNKLNMYQNVPQAEMFCIYNDRIHDYF